MLTGCQADKSLDPQDGSETRPGHLNSTEQKPKGVFLHEHRPRRSHPQARSHCTQAFYKTKMNICEIFLICCLKRYALLEKVAEYNFLKVCKKFAKLVHLDVQLGCHLRGSPLGMKMSFLADPQAPSHPHPPMHTAYRSDTFSQQMPCKNESLFTGSLNPTS